MKADWEMSAAELGESLGGPMQPDGMFQYRFSPDAVERILAAGEMRERIRWRKRRRVPPRPPGDVRSRGGGMS